MLSYGSITVSNIEEGSQIWTTTYAPSAPNYTFTISKLTGDSNASPKKGDIIMHSYYRYTITSVGETTVLAGIRSSIRGSGGASATNVVFGLESISIACDENGNTKSAATVTIPFVGYVGSGRQSCTVEISNLPDGITATGTSATASADGSVVLSIAEGSDLGGADNGIISITLKCNTMTFPKRLAWSKSIDGTDGTNGISSTSIVCGNESQAIVCTSGGLADGAQEIVIPYAGYIGMNRAACTVTYSTLPDGVSLKANGDVPATNQADGSLTFTVANNATLGNAATKNGVITLTFSCNSQTFVKKFSWAKVIAGANGTSITVSSVQYQAGTSSTTAPTGNWSDTVVDVPEGQYLWSKTTFSNGSVVYNVSKQGVSGDNFTWNLIENSLNPGYTDNYDRPHIIGQNDYTWVNSTADLAATHGIQSLNTNASRTYICFGAYNGSKVGLNGLVPGKTYTFSCDCYWNLLGGTNSNSTTYYLRTWFYDDSANPGTFAINTYKDTATLSSAKKGIDDSGRLEITFTVGPNATKNYLYTSTNMTTASHYKAGNYLRFENVMLVEGETAAPWSPAYSDLVGKGISNITNYYLATSASSGVTTSTSGWTTEIQTMTSTNKYLWNYEVTTYTSGEVDTSDPCIIGNYSADGRGITSIVEHYKASDSNSTAPTSWETTVPTLDSTNRYLWNYETINYTVGDPEDTLKRVIGVYGDSGIDATNIVVGSESVSIPCDSEGKTKAASTITIPYAGYEGTTRKACTVAVTNLPTGITVNTGSSSSATTSADGSLVLSVANASNLGGGVSGTITLTFTCNGFTFVRKFAWSKSIDGVNGISATSIVCGNEAQSIICTSGGLVDGAQEIVIPFAGYEGTARKACTVTYSTLPSGIDLKTNGNSPATTNADGSLTFTVADGGTLGGAAVKTGVITLTFTCNSKTFVKKFTWSKAIAGTNGTSITISSIKYQAGTSPTTAPTGSWSDTVVDVEEGQYLWAQTTYSNGSVVYNVSKQGVSGDKFAWNLMQNTLNPGYTSTEDRPYIGAGAYLSGNREDDISATHGIKVVNTNATRTFIRFGSDGSDANLCGLVPGKTYTLSADCYWNLLGGTSSNSTTYYFRACLHDDRITTGTIPTTNSEHYDIATLSTAKKGIDDSGRCVFTFTIPSNVTKLYLAFWVNMSTNSHYKAGNYIRLENIMLAEGDTPAPWGPAYSDLVGNGIQSIVNHYLATSASSGVTTSTSGWTTTIQTVTSTNKYLWNYETVTYTDGSTNDTSPVIIGTYGSTGKGIASIVEHYQVSTSNSTPPTTWETTVPSMTSTNKYLWNYETINYTEGDPKDTEKRVIGVYGNKGDDGISAYIESSNGTTFKGSTITTALTPYRVYGSDVSVAPHVIWYKDGVQLPDEYLDQIPLTVTDEIDKVVYTARIWYTGGSIDTSITLATIRDIAATYVFYQLASSAPAKPTTMGTPPTGWSMTEPAYTDGETRDLYTVELTVFTDDTFSYSEVSKSIQYKAAQAAYGQSVNAFTAANAAEAKANKLMIDNEIIVGTQTAATQSWKGNASFSALQDGQTILYWLPYAGLSNKSVTLELTLADGETTTGAIPCYYAGTTRITTHYTAGSVLHLTYRAEAVIAGAAPIAGWWADANYTVSNTNNYDRLRYQWAIYAETAIVKQHMIVANPATGKYNHLSTTAFDITKPILYAADAIAINKTSTNTYIAFPGVPLNTSKTGFTGTQYQTVYLVGTLSQNLFTPDEVLFTTDQPTTEDGKIYLALGQMQTTTACYLYPEHPMYRYYNGKFQTISQLAYEAYIALDDTRDDLQDQITTNADAVASNTSAISNIQITQTTFEADLDGITGRVEGLETSVSGLDTRISTEMQQLADQFSFTFNTQSEVENIQKYIRFIDGKIYIGETSSELTLQISNDRISFMSGSDEVAYISNKRLYINDAVFLESITIGNFAFVPRSNGNLSFKKIT